MHHLVPFVNSKNVKKIHGGVLFLVKLQTHHTFSYNSAKKKNTQNSTNIHRESKASKKSMQWDRLFYVYWKLQKFIFFWSLCIWNVTLHIWNTGRSYFHSWQKQLFYGCIMPYFKFQNESLNNEKMIGILFSERKRRTTRFLDERIMKIQTAR